MLLNLPLHPIIIHFPIALLIAGLGVDIAGWILKSDWLKRSATLLLILGSTGAAAAVWSGNVQEEMILKTPAIERTLETHSDSGELTMSLFLAIAATRAALLWMRRLTPRVHLLFIAAWVVCAGLLVRTAYYGGEMVFDLGAGVGASAAPPVADPNRDAPQAPRD
jgi:uncharacterized membrane protein